MEFDNYYQRPSQMELFDAQTDGDFFPDTLRTMYANARPEDLRAVNELLEKYELPMGELSNVASHVLKCRETVVFESRRDGR